MSQDQRAATVALLRQRYTAVFTRILNEPFHAATEYDNLHRYLSIAESINDPDAIAGIHNVLSVLHLVTGDIGSALQAVDVAIRVASADDDPTLQLRAIGYMNNKAETLYDIGDAESALDISIELLALFQQLPTTVAIDPHFYLTNKGHYHLALGQYSSARAMFTDVIADESKSSPAAYAVSMADAYRGLSELYIRESNFERAWQLARLGNEIALRKPTDTNLNYYSALAMAHIAECDHVAAIDPQPYYTRAVEIVEQLGTPVLGAILLLHEARYHYRHQNTNRCIEFVQLARQKLHPSAIHYFDGEITAMLG